MIKLLLTTMLGTLLLQGVSKVYANDKTVVALFGDSITAGINNNFGDGLGLGRLYNDPSYAVPPAPSKNLSGLLNSSRRPSLVPNWGAGGSPSGPSLNPGLVASTNGLGRIINTLVATKNAYAGNAYYVLIMYGSNDFAWSIPPSVTHQNTRLMIQRARAQGFIPVVGTLTPRGDINLSSYNSQIASAAAVEGAVLINHAAVFNNAGGLSLLDDGVHPSSTGYSVIAQTWFDQYLEGIIEQQSPVVAPMINLLFDE